MDSNAKGKCLKYLEKKWVDFGLGKNSLNETQRKKFKEKNNFNYIKINNFCS